MKRDLSQGFQKYSAFPGLTNNIELSNRYNRWPNGWTAYNWTRNPATGVWTPNPTPGPGELLLDTGFDDTTKWSKGGAAWTVAGGVGVGTAANGISLYQAVLVLGNFYQAQFDLKTRTGGSVQLHFGAGTGIFFGPAYSTPADSIINSGRASGTVPTRAGFYGNTFSGTVDNASYKLLPHAQLFAIRNFGRQVNMAAALTMTTGLLGGVVSRLSINADGTYNYLHCWHDGTNIHLDTVVSNLTVVSKINAAAAYGAARVIEIRFAAADSAQAWYNGAQVGADQDVSALAAGTWAGVFGTNSGGSLGSVAWS